MQTCKRRLAGSRDAINVEKEKENISCQFVRRQAIPLAFETCLAASKTTAALGWHDSTTLQALNSVTEFCNHRHRQLREDPGCPGTPHRLSRHTWQDIDHGPTLQQASHSNSVSPCHELQRLLEPAMIHAAILAVLLAVASNSVTFSSIEGSVIKRGPVHPICM